MKKVVITGSTGFIGGFLTDKLIEKNYEVRCFVRKESNTGVLKGKKVEIVEIDYKDIDSLKNGLEGVEMVFHLAALISSTNWDKLYRANTVSTINLIDAYNDVNGETKKFVFVSSIAASGPAEKRIPKKENEIDKPYSLYGKSKLLAEKYLKENGKFDYTIIRPSNVYGPHQKEMMNLVNLIDHRILPLLGNRSSVTSFIYVGDLVDALLLAAETGKSKGETYFIADKEYYSWRTAVKLISKELGNYPFVIPVPNLIIFIIAAVFEVTSFFTKKEPVFSLKDIKSITKNNWIFDSTKISKELGFKQETDLRSGIKKTVDWYNSRKLNK